MIAKGPCLLTNPCGGEDPSGIEVLGLGLTDLEVVDEFGEEAPVLEML
jgi:hypothetical protein